MAGIHLLEKLEINNTNIVFLRDTNKYSHLNLESYLECERRLLVEHKQKTSLI